MLKQHFILPGGFLHPRAGDEGEISFSLKPPLAPRLPRPKGRGILKIFAAKIFNKLLRKAFTFALIIMYDINNAAKRRVEVKMQTKGNVNK
ncbi:MAG: hypothetical protein HY796_11485 [Elusimicrobia bacterium]|nr:hypothetical protein [Elusimicrobiota bacterium]